MNHTPTPWKVEGRAITGPSIDGYKNICDQVRSGQADHDNAAFIVRAVNAHEGMLDLLKSAVETEEKHGLKSFWLARAKQAIAKAEGK